MPHQLLQTHTYFPTICVRPSEMLALEKLPNITKDKILPHVLLAPWLASKSFDKTTERVEKSFGARMQIADLDRMYRSDKDRDAQTTFFEMRDEGGEYSTWTKFIQQNENFIPVVQFPASEGKDLVTQTERLTALGRGVAFYIDISEAAGIDKLLMLAETVKPINPIVIIDAGWRGDEQHKIMFVDRLVARAKRAIPSALFIPTCANFPNSFSSIDGVEAIEIQARLLYQAIRRNHNDIDIGYGDWASAKPRNYDGGGSAPLPRVDYATRSRWIFARSKDREWDFEDAAKVITLLDEWLSHPKVWGSYMIEQTAKDEIGGIDTYRKAIAARMNIHMFIQANADTDSLAEINTDEEWVDI